MSEDEEPESEATLEDVLARVGLQEKAALLHEEQIDMESLVSIVLILKHLITQQLDSGVHIVYLVTYAYLKPKQIRGGGGGS